MPTYEIVTDYGKFSFNEHLSRSYQKGGNYTFKEAKYIPIRVMHFYITIDKMVDMQRVCLW